MSRCTLPITSCSCQMACQSLSRFSSLGYKHFATRDVDINSGSRIGSRPPPSQAALGSLSSMRSNPVLWTSVAKQEKRGGGRRWRGIVALSRSSSDSEMGDFTRRLEQTWGVQKQPLPVPCEACQAQGFQECSWCSGTGYFILGDNMLCEIPSRNTHCVVCGGHGTMRCHDCMGTGFRAKWMPVKGRGLKN